MQKQSILLFLFLSFAMAVQAQETINWENPSFEDIPRAGKLPEKWLDAAYFEEESAPDTQPCQSFEVPTSAYEGNTYLGMVVRENETWEAVTQKLETPLKEGKQHSFSVYLAKSPIYRSAIRTKKSQMVSSDVAKVNFVKPAVLRIWAGDKKQLLATSPAIKNMEWEKFLFEFVPNADYPYITFEAYYELPIQFAYNGNILMDNLSPIIVK
ncbi:MAG: hypothetical protein RLZZ292_180 [Bacteroidota bacterium]|jgi:hypothetical protein